MNHSKKSLIISGGLQGEQNKPKALIKVFFKLLISAFFLYYVFTKVDFKAIIDIFLSSNPLLLMVALCFFVFSKLTSSHRLNLYFHRIDLPLTEKSNIKLYLLGMFYNLFLPGGIGGDGYKIYLLSNKTGAGVKKLIWVVFLDRLTGMLALTLSALFMAGFMGELGKFRYYPWILAFLGLLSTIIIARYFLKEFRSILKSVALYSLIVQLMQMISVVFILMAFNVFDSYLQYLTAFLVSSVVSVLPLTIGGAGAREITFLYCAGLLSLDADIAVTLSLTFYLITVVTSMTGLYFVFRPVSLKLASA